MVELGVVGAKNSGKTTVIEGLVEYLVGEKYRVATIKHTSHSHRFDTPGKDTYRHRTAGALMTVAVSAGEVAIFAEADLLDLRQIQSIINQPIDIWLIEGDRQSDRPKILVTRHLKELSGELPENIVATIGPEKLDGVPAHFAAGDYMGLGSSIAGLMSDKKTGIRE